MKEKTLLILLILGILLFPNVIALPDLVIEKIDFYNSEQCKNNPENKCSYYNSESESEHPFMYTEEIFFAKPVFKNIGESQTNSTWSYSTYVNGKWSSTIVSAGRVFSVPSGLEVEEIAHKTWLVKLKTNEILPSKHIAAGGARVNEPGYHNVTIILNEGNSFEESDYSNNVFTKIIYSDYQKPPECECDEDCEDGNPDTWDYCGENTREEKVCFYNQPYTLYGEVINIETGINLSGKEISIYDSSVYNPFTGEGNFSALVPKESPDTLTNQYGRWYLNIADGMYHVIVKGSQTYMYNAVVNNSKGKEQRDTGLNQNIHSTIFNANGHVIYSGKHNGANNYVCGEKIKFTMFGVNNGETNETISFTVKDHTTPGNPHLSPRIYNGSVDNENEILTVPAGEKIWKEFYWKIPCGLNYGRHAIYVMWNDETWHMIGNFFVEEDVTNPGITIQEINGVPINLTDKASVHVNENITIQYKAWENPQPGTMRIMYSSMIGYDYPDISVTVDKKDNGETDISGLIGGDDKSFTTSYNESGNYQMAVTAEDLSGNTATAYVNVTVFITEEEADAIAVPWYAEFYEDIVFFNQNYDISFPWIGRTINADRYTEDYQAGDEYLTPENNDSLTEWEIYQSHKQQYGVFGSPSPCQGSPNFEPIYGTTSEGYNYTLINYLCYLKNVCNNGNLLSVCGTTNFAPQIYDYLPKEYNTSIKTFEIITRDANREPINVTWYLKTTLEEGYLPVYESYISANEGGISEYTYNGTGNAHIKVVVRDSANSEDLDEYNWQNYHEWYYS